MKNRYVFKVITSKEESFLAENLLEARSMAISKYGKNKVTHIKERIVNKSDSEKIKLERKVLKLVRKHLYRYARKDFIALGINPSKAQAMSKIMSGKCDFRLTLGYRTILKLLPVLAFYENEK